MKEFDIELAKQGKPVCTRDGRNVEIFKFDADNKYPVFGMIQEEDSDEIMAWNKRGRYNEDIDSPFDLMMASNKHEGWVNIYKHENGEYTAGVIFETREECVYHQSSLADCVHVVKIEWEE